MKTGPRIRCCTKSKHSLPLASHPSSLPENTAVLKILKLLVRFFTPEDIKLGNTQITLVHFLPEYSGFKGNVYNIAGKVLKNNHGMECFNVIYSLGGSLNVQGVNKCLE